ncbi:putative F-box domain, leucine-rich repeat domain, L domain-containing protein [Rosa chinensis]|uniref:Putative F-box domain, leucine-rich repeat domain, L domain-containing protein n=1 Tax=Rosa chinensis TaxID=74649 RepID=A0A2P6PK53_ROSCH|nr:F-box/FBD/LRR-repeat protein At1g13570 isoform X1 [Rosa chinensis]XP_040364633.1 F-box/FBD/LRR-repeat protein At1g13570 isoform X1 [Rosa chinensis]PRQ22296.1 putative F-box domain, leucine-rich repeat domain, L domain-containing protein [Rosa chinensis]
MELDRISSLPNDVTEKILSGLPLKEAVRTSILSRKWRYKSDMLQALVFDDECLETQSHPTFSFVNIVDHVLLLHKGPIHRFQLSFNGKLATRDIDRWIFHLSRNPVIKEMILDNFEGDIYNIPSCLFSFQDIVHLELFRCLLNPPSTFKGFGSLKSLDLWSVTLAQDVFDNLIGCSPLLKILKLQRCDGFTNLKIDAPKLLFIYIVGDFEDFNLVDSSNLVDASFDLQVIVDQRGNCSSFGNLLKFFDHQLPHIQRLTIKRNFLKYLSIGALPEKLPKPCQYLNFLSLDMNFDNPDEISTVLCLLRSSPALQELKILVDPKKDQSAVGEVESCLYDNYNCAYTQLRLVEITKISGVKAQLDFIESLLLSSPLLERMTVQPASVNGSFKLVKDLLLFKRDSKGAEIMVLDP